MMIETKISSLQELLDFLPSCSPQDYNELAKDMELDISDFERYIHWDAVKYTRNCIVRTEAYELILLCWEEDQATSIHCHGGEECWVYNLKGQIEEEYFQYQNERLTLVDSHMLNQGGVTYMNDSIGYHKLINKSKGRAMTLHLYMNPIDECTAWNTEIGQFVPIKLKYNSIGGGLV